MQIPNTSLVEKTKELLSRHPHWQKVADDLIDHGIGLIPSKEHDYLVKEGAISCDGEVDMILCDYSILVKEGRGKPIIIDCDGNLVLLKQELSVMQGAEIRYYPKKYETYIANKRRSWKDDEAEMPLPVEDGVSIDDILSIIP